MASFSTTATVDDPRISLGEGARADSPDYARRLRRGRLGLLVALTPVIMLFVSFSSAYVVRQGLPTLDPRSNQLVRDWIPVTLPKLLLINTGVLVLSSLFMELARRQIKRQVTGVAPVTVEEVSIGDRAKIPWLAVTTLLGLLFLLGQRTAWRQLAANGFYVATTPSSSFVYLLTGTHAIHLMGGVLALFVAGMASLLRRSVATRSIVVDVTAWYWHFMAALWIYILCLLEFAS
jgi:cytochrome c oxidase subunit 3